MEDTYVKTEVGYLLTKVTKILLEKSVLTKSVENYNLLHLNTSM